MTSRFSLRPRVFGYVLIFIPGIALANPVMVDPGSAIAFGIVALSAFIVEAGVAAVCLLFCGMAPLRVFVAYFFINAAAFIIIFNPMIQRGMPWTLAEVLIVGIDCAVIKMLAAFDVFEGDDFEDVTWRRAAVVSLAVNAFSFFVGVVASGAPWFKKPDYMGD